MVVLHHRVDIVSIIEGISIDRINGNKGKINKRYDGIGEGRYTKVVLSQYKSDGSIAGFEKVSKNRGTSISVLLSSYNLDTKQ